MNDRDFLKKKHHRQKIDVDVIHVLYLYNIWSSITGILNTMSSRGYRINPGSLWRFSVWQLTSQHPYAEVFIGEPYVYTVHVNNEEEILKVLDKILQNKEVSTKRSDPLCNVSQYQHSLMHCVMAGTSLVELQLSFH